MMHVVYLLPSFKNLQIERSAFALKNPEITVRPNDKPWFNSDLRREIRKRNRLHKIARKYKKNKW